MHWIAHLIGLFYVFSGLIVLRCLAQDRLIDQAIAGISGQIPSKNEYRQTQLLHIMAALTLTSGLALATLSRWSFALFGINTLFQVAYLRWARQATPPANDDERAGRRATIRAAGVYAIATAGVCLLAHREVLTGWTFLPAGLQSLWIEGLGLGLIAAVAVYHFHRASRLGLGRGLASKQDWSEPASLPAAPPATTQPLRLAPEFCCWPLWNDTTGENLKPDELPLPFDLIERIQTWDSSYQAIYLADNPPASRFATPEDEARYQAEGRAIAEALRAAWPDGVTLHLP